MPPGLKINFRGELFSATATFGAMLVLRLGSSIVMSRLLYPEAYGLLAILMSIAFALEMLSDIGVTGFLIRHERGGEQAVINTLWTVRLVRGILNAAVLYALAPWIGSIYGDPLVGDCLQVLSIFFVLGGLETLGFVQAMRNQRARVVAYVELACTAVTTACTIVIAYHLRNHWALVFSILLQRSLMTLCSYFVYPENRPRIGIDKTILLPLFNFAKVIMPASMLNLAFSQYDKIIFLKLFDIRVMGLYGVATNMSGTVSGLAIKVSHTVLYPRCAHWNLTTPALFAQKLYAENKKMLLPLVVLPAMVGGLAQPIVDIIYDPRYSQAGMILKWAMVRASFEALLFATLSILNARGYIKGELISNFIRLIGVVSLTGIGYYSFGLTGFLAGAAIEPLLALIFVTYKRYRLGLFDVRADFMIVTLGLSTWAAFSSISYFAA